MNHFTQACRAERKAMCARWAVPLSEKTGRTVDELQTDGLFYTDFPFEGVRIEYEDGSEVNYRSAFYVRDKALPARVAIFTEHCGYHEVLLWPDDQLS